MTRSSLLLAIALVACEEPTLGPCRDMVINVDSWDLYSCKHPDHQIEMAGPRVVICRCRRDGAAHG